VSASRAHWLRVNPPALASRSISALVSTSTVVLTTARFFPGPFGGFFVFGMRQSKTDLN
jgi:hypothetical protein